jgi:hypothetical protein
MDTDTLMEDGTDVSGLPDVHMDPNNRLCLGGGRPIMALVGTVGTYVCVQSEFQQGRNRVEQLL